MRKTKIVCTLGPATSSEDMVSKLIEAGMNVARLNFSHGTYEEFKQSIALIRDVSRRLKQPVAILQDLQGPKLRINTFKTGKVQLKKGDPFSITTDSIIGNKRRVATSYKQLPQDVYPGDKILLDDGLIQLKVTDVQSNQVICEIIEGGELSDHKGINLPNVNISQPSITEKDCEDLLFGIEQGVDLVAISFVRSADDIRKVKNIIAEKNSDIQVIAKLEKPEAINKLDDILTIADGVMVARGDLGVEMPLEKVPPLQKKIIRLALQKGKPVITATQMLESMRFYSRPTRAEVSDVANAIFDSSDAVMLSAETAVGKYPIETVRTMAKIIKEAEQVADRFTPQYLLQKDKTQSIADAISHSACEAAEQLRAKAIVSFTTSGFTARMVAKYRPNTSIIAFTPSDIVQRQLNLIWGVLPIKMDFLHSTQEIVNLAEQILLAEKIVKPDDVIVVLLGVPVFERGTTNLMKLHIIGK